MSDQDGDPVTVAVTGLPPGVTFNDKNRRLTGTLGADGVYVVTITASDGISITTVTFTWTVAG